jgi:amino acid permease
VRTFLQFMGVWGGLVAVTVFSLAILMWLLSVDDDPRDKQVASSLLWAMFWPVIWLYWRFTGKDSAISGPRGFRSRTSAGESNVGPV